MTKWNFYRIGAWLMQSAYSNKVFLTTQILIHANQVRQKMKWKSQNHTIGAKNTPTAFKSLKPSHATAQQRMSLHHYQQLKTISAWRVEKNLKRLNFQLKKSLIAIKQTMVVQVEMWIKFLLGARDVDSYLKLASHSLERKKNARMITSRRTCADRPITFTK